MAVHHGKNGKVKLSSNVVGEVTKFSVNETVETADATSMTDTAKTHIAGIPGWTAKVEANFDPADTNGQVAMTIGASVTFNGYTDGDATGKKYLTGTATIVGRDVSADMGDVVKASFDLLGNGALSIGTAS